MFVYRKNSFNMIRLFTTFNFYYIPENTVIQPAAGGKYPML